MPTDTVSVIITDSENKKWIGFKGGFTIFDEITWEIHIMFQPPSYISILQNMILEENGNAWLDFRHYGSGLFKYDGDTIINMLWPPGPYNYIADMNFDSEGNLWMPIWSGMSDFGLAMYDGIEFTVYDFTEMTDYLHNRSQSIEIDENDNKWIGSLDNGLLKFKDGEVEQINEGIIGLRYPRDLAIENNDRIWLTNNDGLIEYNSGEWNFYSYYNSEFPGESSGCVAIDKNKKKWIGGENQLITFDDENWYVYDTSNSPITYGNQNLIDNILIDKNETKWFSKSGLYEYDNESWNLYTTDNSELPSNGIECMAVDSSGVIWLGHLGIGVSSFDGEEWILYDTTIVGPQIFYPRSIYVDSTDTKWICTYGGLLSYDGSNWIIYDTSNTGLPSNKLNDMIFDNSGKMWVGTKKGIGVYDGDTWMIYDSTNSSLKRNRVIKLSQSDNNDIWIIHQDGLSIYNENGFINIKEHPNNISSLINLSGFPNPFNSVTTIQFNLQQTIYGELSIFNLAGQKITSIYKGEFLKGENHFKWDSTNANGHPVKNGIYFCQLFTNKPVGTCKLILSRN